MNLNIQHSVIFVTSVLYCTFLYSRSDICCIFEYNVMLYIRIIDICCILTMCCIFEFNNYKTNLCVQIYNKKLNSNI